MEFHGNSMEFYETEVHELMSYKGERET
jgi:hypothetical protein